MCAALASERSCGEACIYVRSNGEGGGLALRPGQLRFAAPGEKVVVEVEARDGEAVELGHPDATMGKVRLRKPDDG